MKNTVTILAIFLFTLVASCTSPTWSDTTNTVDIFVLVGLGIDTANVSIVVSPADGEDVEYVLRLTTGQDTTITGTYDSWTAVSHYWSGTKDGTWIHGSGSLNPVDTLLIP